MEQSSGQSPFAIPREDIEALNASHGFMVLRSYLAKDADFCAQHSRCDPQTKETWLLHRDLLHALIMPVVELFKRASALAEAALCTHKSEDLELAFAGEARGAFLCLQCFIHEEEDWCRTRGCPACVTTTTLSTESHIRLTIAASLLSTVSTASPNSSPMASTTSSPVNTPVSEEPSSTRTLPPLPHILPALREALSADPFWGPDVWTYLLSRATQLSVGIQALITSCIDLESLVSSPARPGQTHSITTPNMHFVTSGAPKAKGAKLRKSKLAKRQLRLVREEVEMMRRIALQCWARAQVPKNMRGEMLGRGEGPRRRSLTCP